MKVRIFGGLVTAALLFIVWGATAQVNSGSNGSDGAFNPTTSTNINMSSHPDGIYQYTSVYIPAGVTVSFIKNSNNAPVVWLVQTYCSIAGTVSLAGQRGDAQWGGDGGPGGFRGGNGGWGSASAGQGPGGGMRGGYAFSASFGTVATLDGVTMTNGAGAIYGNSYLLPLVGGSGGGGTADAAIGGGGGGGAILIAASEVIVVNGTILASGGDNTQAGWSGPKVGAGGGSGGGIRLITSTLWGSGTLNTVGGAGGGGSYGGYGRGGYGRVRFDALDNHFTGAIYSTFTQGFQPIIIPPPSQAVSLAIQSVGGVAVRANPSGFLSVPDVVIPGQQANPISIVVRCANIPLNTPIIVDVKPANDAAIELTAPNNVGTQASSLATAFVNMPRGGGTIQAQAVSGITNLFAGLKGPSDRAKSLAQTGWTADGERFAAVEVTVSLGGAPQVAYLTQSGQRYLLPAN